MICNQMVVSCGVLSYKVDIGLKMLQGLPHNIVLEIWDLPSSPAIVELMKDIYFEGTIKSLHHHITSSLPHRSNHIHS
jgi:hypothetical protein